MDYFNRNKKCRITVIEKELFGMLSLQTSLRAEYMRLCVLGNRILGNILTQSSID